MRSTASPDANELAEHSKDAEQPPASRPPLGARPQTKAESQNPRTSNPVTVTGTARSPEPSGRATVKCRRPTRRSAAYGRASQSELPLRRTLGADGAHSHGLDGRAQVREVPPHKTCRLQLPPRMPSAGPLWTTTDPGRNAACVRSASMATKNQAEYHLIGYIRREWGAVSS